MTVPTLVAAAVAAVVAAALQAGFLLFAQVSVGAAALVAGVVLGVQTRPDAVRDVALPAAVVGLAATVAALLVMASRGTPVLEARYLLGWVVTAAVGALLAGGVAWLTGRVPGLAR